MKYITKYIFLILIAQWQMLVVLSKLRINLDQFEILTKELVKLFRTNLFLFFLNKNITIIKVFPFYRVWC